MATLSDLEKLRADISVLEARLKQLEEPAPATDFSGSAGEIMEAVQHASEAERLRLQERQTLLLSLPVLKQRQAQMEVECAALRQELDKKLGSLRKLSSKLNSSLEGILAQIDELRTLGQEAEGLCQKAYGQDASRAAIWTDHWREHQFDFPAIIVLANAGSDTFSVVLTTQARKSGLRTSLLKDSPLQNYSLIA